MSTPLFVTSVASVQRHMVFAIERKPPVTLRAQGTSCVAVVGQFPWGPTESVYEPSGIGDAINTFAPPGFDRTLSGYLGITGKGFPQLKIVGVRSPTAVAASAVLETTGGSPTAVCTVHAKYAAIAGNSIVATTSDADDADPNHFNLTVSITGASGTTTEVIKNINFSGTGPDSTFDLSQSNLLSSITRTASGLVARTATTFTSGTSPAVVSSDYVGTSGTGDKGLSLLEGYKDVRHVAVDDCGNSLRAAVNAGLVAHAEFCGDRIAFLNGNSGQAASAAQSDAATFSSKQTIYVDPWYNKADDIDGTLRLVGGSILAASVAAQTSPSTSIAWKDPSQRALLRDVVSLEANRGDQAGTNTEAGVVTIIPEETGGFSFESAHVTSYPADPDTGDLTRTRMAIYIVTAFTAAARPMIDAPNVETNQDALVMALSSFLDGLQRAAKSDPNHTPHILGYTIGDPASVNTDDQEAAGIYFLPADVKTSPAMEKIGLSLSIGPTVKLSAAL